ncbi:poly [ADP-ribose] polymerase [Leptopilina heterotoma]|uniref:poly [ADP-ribose] polymerase n=1 Tax=Leptopilina heterotoma TaxID=63436 RepID=UPI001CA8F590|nr:poly [ADP-ribose] polymerase [Leptopilina heterotoma]
MTDLPFRVEYAKSGRAGCKACKNPIAKDSLRLASIVQSPFHDGKMEKWFHSACFFSKNRPKTTGDIAHFDSIRWEDQNFIKEQIGANAGGGAVDSGNSKGKSRKRTNNATPTNNNDFTVEYSKSSRAKCRACEEVIIKGDVRISKKDYDSEEGRAFGGIDRWHHVPCFVKIRNDLEYYDAGNNIPGFKNLSGEDQKMVKTTIPKLKESEIPDAKKIKVKDEPEDAAEEKKMQEQNKKMFKIRDKLSKNGYTRPFLTQLLAENEQFVPEGTSSLQDMLADVMTFGALDTCKQCGGQFKFQSGVGYKCTGDVSEWAKCEEIVVNPKRRKFVIPKELKETDKFLSSYKSKVMERVVKITAPSVSSAVKKEDVTDGPKVDAGPKPLKNMNFLFAGRLKKDKESLKTDILRLGGKVVTKLDDTVTAVISTENEVEKMSARIEEAKELDIHVISEDFVEEAKPLTDSAVELLQQKSICTWGGDPTVRISKSAEKSNASRGKSMWDKKSSSGKVKLRIKGGGAVDPDSKLEDVAHVYQRGKEKFNVNLGITDIQSKRNSYYKMQILKHDSREKYWLHRSWGRIGTTIGGTKTTSMSLEECIKTFEEVYEEKSGNSWQRRDNFVKVPGAMYPLDLEYGDDVDDENVFQSELKSNLKKPVQDLIKLIFDVKAMKQVMKEFEIDTEKMPLGKLSKKQIEKAYGVLTDLLNLIKNSNPSRLQLIEASNRFYTLVPHDFGVQEPTIISTEEEIKAKSEMLESLIEMEIAYNLLHVKSDSTVHPIDAHYEQLKSEIDVMSKDSEEFKVIQQYVKNTHAATHQQYELEIEDIYIVKRQGEDRRYKPFKKLHNRKLLWHGSRTTNFAGILSQGLRIAPPEAPVTGYMFGKGIYFADMVSKSANYCCTNSANPTGLLLLCEVALGDMFERYQAEYIEKLPTGKHSTFGRGQTHPDPTVVHKTSDGVEIPYGPGITAKLPKKSALLYNEYIVYDVAQVKSQYLVKTNFKFKY